MWLIVSTASPADVRSTLRAAGWSLGCEAMSSAIDQNELLTRTWDYIIIGTGIGGATLGYTLAKQNRTVLFLERGKSYLQNPDALTGDWLEAILAGAGTAPTKDQKLRAGRSSDELLDITGAVPRTLRPLLGAGVGGSSAIFGMVMERFFPADFTPGRFHRDSPSANVPETWPISYKELEPYYARAEALYGVRAERDPLRPTTDASGALPPPPLSPATQELSDRLKAKGLHPYHLPIACEFVPGCRECLGYLCAKNCKHDSATTCLEPALRDHGAAMLTECEVETFASDDGRITGVNARWRGEAVCLTGKTVVLAAGAVNSPAILLRSGGPTGLGNGSGQVGRNLMRHFLDYWIVYPKNHPKTGLLKQIAINDFYMVDGMKLGTLQSNGAFGPAKSLAAAYHERLKRRSTLLGLLFKAVFPLAEFRIKLMMAKGYVFMGCVEDRPYSDNRITLAEDRRKITLNYSISPQDRIRLNHFRGKVSDAMGPHHFKTMQLADENRMLGHVSGTIRFGDDPETSVLDRNNRSHELANLYVVDASFLPTSAGTNPSLTIAANALRVADILLSAACPHQS